MTSYALKLLNVVCSRQDYYTSVQTNPPIPFRPVAYKNPASPWQRALLCFALGHHSNLLCSVYRCVHAHASVHCLPQQLRRYSCGRKLPLALNATDPENAPHKFTHMLRYGPQRSGIIVPIYALYMSPMNVNYVKLPLAVHTHYHICVVYSAPSIPAKF